jgi:GntR family transcriptional repressor for pyruvate dehydrogenase complex
LDEDAGSAILAAMSSTQHSPADSDDGSFELDAIPASRLYEGVISQVHRLIRDGHLKPGDKLPPERELVARFKVGRSSIRDAIRVLEVMGTVRVRQGGGTVVQDLSPRSLVAPLATMLQRRRELVSELMDLRKILEPPLAARAARKATPEDLARLDEVLARQAEKTRRGEPAVDEDAEFHRGIAQAGGNQVVLNVLDILMDLLAETRVQTLQVRGRSQRSMAGHRRILQAIRRRDPAAAERSMRNHIRSVEEIILQEL